MIQDLPNKNIKLKKVNNKLKIAIVRSNYHANLTKSLEKACRETLVDYGVKRENIETFQVPGSWEIPLIAKKVLEAKKFDGVVALGVIIKGETHHFEMIAQECSRALMDIALTFNTPITFEVLATYNLEQAEKRSIGKYNKGIEAARALVETITQVSKL